MNSDGAARAGAYAALAELANGRMPWLYEGATEVFRQLVFGTSNKAAETEKRFRQLVRELLQSPLGREYHDRDKSTFRIYELLRQIA